MVLVAADWLVVNAATAKIATAIMNGHLLGEVAERADTIASSLFAMNVSAIQAMPKRAIIATMPDVKIDMFGMSDALTLQKTSISAAAVSITIWMIGVTDRGLVPPSSVRTVGRMPSNRPKMQITSTAPRKIATLRLAKGMSTISLDGAGGWTSPASTRRRYSVSSSRFRPCRLITTTSRRCRRCWPGW